MSETKAIEMKVNEGPIKTENSEAELLVESNIKKQPLLINKDTRDILELLKKELKEIYWDDVSSDDDVVLYLYSYYCRK